jgi:hypothetical protein
MHDVLLFHEVGDRQRDAGIRGVADDVDLLGINPLPCDVNANVGLVLVVATDDVDLPALGDEAGILDRHLDRGNRIGTADVGIEARHVVQHADLDGLVLGLVLGQCWRREAECGKRHGGGEAPRNSIRHGIPPEIVVRRLSFRNLPAALR